MNAKAQVIPSDDPWEDRNVGADDQFVSVGADIGAALDASLDLHPISIRLQKNLIDNLKALAQLNGLGYQPLIRQILTRWVDSELKQMLVARAHEASVRGGESQAPSDEPTSLEPGRRAA